jgi:addiction module HigA family antidote
MNLSPYAVATAVGVPRTRIERVVTGVRSITADTALRLAAFFGTTPKFWLDMQAEYDLDRAAARISAALRKIEPGKRVTNARGVESQH